MRIFWGLGARYSEKGEKRAGLEADHCHMITMGLEQKSRLRGWQRLGPRSAVGRRDRYTITNATIKGMKRTSGRLFLLRLPPQRFEDNATSTTCSRGRHRRRGRWTEGQLMLDRLGGKSREGGQRSPRISELFNMDDENLCCANRSRRPLS